MILQMISRRKFLIQTSSGIFASFGLESVLSQIRLDAEKSENQRADLLIVGGGLGGCSAALAALRKGLHVILSESTDWLGGQLTSQGVPPDEHSWIETRGANASYRAFRNDIRAFYKRHFPLTETAHADPFLNPGLGSVSRLCHEPRVALAVLLARLLPYQSGGQLRIFLEHLPIAASVDGDVIKAISLQNLSTQNAFWIEAPFFVDATELGDLLPITKTEHVIGNEGKSKTGELHAPIATDEKNQQAFTCCFALEHRAGENHTIAKPAHYAFWRNYKPALNPPWPGRLFDLTYTHPRSGKPRRLAFDPAHNSQKALVNLWTYRRIAAKSQFEKGRYESDLCLVNWPQNDYLEGLLVGVNEAEKKDHIARAKELNESLLYWLQTEAPRMDGGTGFSGLRIRNDIFGSEDGMAKHPYIRESRRICALFTITEKHCGKEQRQLETGLKGKKLHAAQFEDSIGIGHYPIDLHPTHAGYNYIDFETLPFELALGALLPQRVHNLLPACKNIGTTHLTNGCYRTHPIEWGIGEAVGTLISYSLREKIPPVQVLEKALHLTTFQEILVKQGVSIRWKT